MRTIIQPRASHCQRILAAALSLLGLIAGVLPEMHHHEADVAVEAHCHDSGQSSSTHLETLEPAHHDACGLCAKTVSFAWLERPQAKLAGELVFERAPEGSRILPPGPPGRDGASRAPPLA